MNVVTLIGNLCKDPEVKFTASGLAVLKNTLAVKNPYVKDKTDFITITAWKKTAEIMGEYLKKGSKIGVSGRISTGSYEKDGVKIYTTEVVIDRMEMLDKKPDAPEGTQSVTLAQANDMPTDGVPF